MNAPVGSVTGGVALVTVDGAPLPPAYAAALMAVEVDLRVNVPGRALITINPVNFAEDRVQGLDFALFALGAEVTVAMGRNAAKPVFAGRIYAVAPEFTAAGQRVTVTAYDGLYALQFGTKARVFENLTISGIVEEVAGGAGLAVEAEPTTALYPYTAQLNQSDYHFLLMLARQSGAEMIPNGQTLRFAPPVLDGAPVARLEFGAGLSVFAVRARALTQGSTVKRLGWNALEKTLIEGEAASSSPEERMGGEETGFEMSQEAGTSATAAPDPAITDPETAEALAKAARGAAADGFVTGDAACPGNPALAAGRVVQIAAVSSRFDGPYYVTGARHRYGAGEGYRTDLDLRRTGL